MEETASVVNEQTQLVKYKERGQKERAIGKTIKTTRLFNEKHN